MILGSILLIILLALAIAITFTLLVGGAGIVLVFGDLIVCICLFWLLVRLFRRKKRK